MPRKPKPINLHIIEGNKSRLTSKEIKARKEAEQRFSVGTDKTKPPPWLSKEAQSEFTSLSKMLKEAGIISNLDVNMLSVFCLCYVRYVECNRIIEADGLVIRKKGVEVPHPLLRVQKNLFEQMARIASDFGLTPASRARLAIPKKPKQKKTEFEKMFDV